MSFGFLSGPEYGGGRALLQYASPKVWSFCVPSAATDKAHAVELLGECGCCARARRHVSTGVADTAVRRQQGGTHWMAAYQPFEGWVGVGLDRMDWWVSGKEGGPMAGSDRPRAVRAGVEPGQASFATERMLGYLT